MRIRKRTEVNDFPLDYLAPRSYREDFFDQNHPDWFRDSSHFSKIRHISDECRGEAEMRGGMIKDRTTEEGRCNIKEEGRWNIKEEGKCNITEEGRCNIKEEDAT